MWENNHKFSHKSFLFKIWLRFTFSSLQPSVDNSFKLMAAMSFSFQNLEIWPPSRPLDAPLQIHVTWTLVCEIWIHFLQWRTARLLLEVIRGGSRIFHRGNLYGCRGCGTNYIFVKIPKRHKTNSSCQEFFFYKSFIKNMISTFIYAKGVTSHIGLYKKCADKNTWTYKMDDYELQIENGSW